MTEYNLFPPIRFQFEGHAETARSGIPQARTLMQQMIRRMEIGEVEALCWRVNTAEGMYFEIHKYGDQHIALIRAPETPIVPEEKGKKSGGSLWIGARSVISPELIDTLTEAEFYSIEQGWWQAYQYQGTQVRSYPDLTYEILSEAFIDHLFLPAINLMLFEPAWNQRTEGNGVTQSALANLYAAYPDVYKADEVLAGALSDATSWTWFGEGDYSKTINVILSDLNVTATVIYDWGQTYSDEYTWHQYYREVMLSTTNQCFTSFPYQYIPNEFEGDCHSYLILDSNDGDGFKPYQYYQEYAGSQGTVYSGRIGDPRIAFFAANTLVEITTKPDPNDPDATWSRPEDSRTTTYTWSENYLSEQYNVFTPPSLPPQSQVNILDGLYELRVSIGDRDWPNRPEPPADSYTLFGAYGLPLQSPGTWDLEIFIRNGTTLPMQTYPITINLDMSDFDYNDDNSFLFMQDQYMNGQIPTKKFMWYDGCWLIDIKQGTIIHETNPDKLSRDWLV